MRRASVYAAPRTKTRFCNVAQGCPWGRSDGIGEGAVAIVFRFVISLLRGRTVLSVPWGARGLRRGCRRGIRGHRGRGGCRRVGKSKLSLNAMHNSVSSSGWLHNSLVGWCVASLSFFQHAFPLAGCSPNHRVIKAWICRSSNSASSTSAKTPV